MSNKDIDILINALIFITGMFLTLVGMFNSNYIEASVGIIMMIIISVMDGVF